MHRGVEFSQKVSTTHQGPRFAGELLRHRAPTNALKYDAATSVCPHDLSDGGGGYSRRVNRARNAGFMIHPIRRAPLAKQLKHLVVSPGIDFGDATLAD
jgi:hypothetical protein